VKSNAINFLLIPNAVFLTLELLFIIAVPFLIYRLSRRPDPDSNHGNAHKNNGTQITTNKSQNKYKGSDFKILTKDPNVISV